MIPTKSMTTSGATMANSTAVVPRSSLQCQLMLLPHGHIIRTMAVFVIGVANKPATEIPLNSGE